VTLADERARQQGTQTSAYTGAPVFDHGTFSGARLRGVLHHAVWTGPGNRDERREIVHHYSQFRPARPVCSIANEAARRPPSMAPNQPSRPGCVCNCAEKKTTGWFRWLLAITVPFWTSPKAKVLEKYGRPASHSSQLSMSGRSRTFRKTKHLKSQRS
jgi:hypothetical protein